MAHYTLPTPVRAAALAVSVLLSAGVVLADSHTALGLCLASLTTVLLACSGPTMLAIAVRASDDSE